MSLLMDALKRAEKARSADGSQGTDRGASGTAESESPPELSLDPLEDSSFEDSEKHAARPPFVDEFDRRGGGDPGADARRPPADAIPSGRGAASPSRARSGFPGARSARSEEADRQALGDTDIEALELAASDLDDLTLEPRPDVAAEPLFGPPASEFSLVGGDDELSFSDTAATLPSMKAARRSVDDYFDGTSSISLAMDQFDDSQLRDLEDSLARSGQLEDSASSVATTQRRARARAVVDAGARRGRSESRRKLLLALTPLLFTLLLGTGVYVYWNTLDRMFFAPPAVIARRPEPGLQQPVVPVDRTDRTVAGTASAGAAGASGVATATAPLGENRVEEVLLANGPVTSPLTNQNPNASTNPATGDTGRPAPGTPPVQSEASEVSTGQGVEPAPGSASTPPGQGLALAGSGPVAGVPATGVLPNAGLPIEAAPRGAAVNDQPELVRAAIAARERFAGGRDAGVERPVQGARGANPVPGSARVDRPSRVGAARAGTAATTPSIDDPSPTASITGMRIAKRSSPNRVSGLLRDAYEDFQRGDVESANRHYRRALGRDRRNRDALLGLAAVQVQQGKLSEASEIYARLLRQNPRDSAAHAGLLALAADTDPLVGESQIKTMLRREPAQAYLHFNLGNVYARQARWPEAQKAYFDAFRLEDDNPDYAFNLAVALDQLRQGKPAAEYYHRALELSANRYASFDGRAVQTRLVALGR